MHDSEIFFNSEQTKNLSQHSEKVSTYSIYSCQLLSLFLTNLSPPHDTRRSKPLYISVLIKSSPKRLRRILRRVLHTLYGKNIFVPLSPHHPTQPDSDNPLRISIGKSAPKRVRRRLAVNLCILQAGLSDSVMVSKKRKIVELSTASDGGNAAGDSGVDDDYGTKKYTEILGFYDEGVPRTLYQIWRTAMQRVCPGLVYMDLRRQGETALPSFVNGVPRTRAWPHWGRSIITRNHVGLRLIS